jgi:hypothetical protein
MFLDDFFILFNGELVTCCYSLFFLTVWKKSCFSTFDCCDVVKFISFSPLQEIIDLFFLQFKYITQIAWTLSHDRSWIFEFNIRQFLFMKNILFDEMKMMNMSTAKTVSFYLNDLVLKWHGYLIKYWLVFLFLIT